jgi:hypothetical protein
MNQYQIALVALIIAQIVALRAMWKAQDTGEWYRKAWLRDSTELLYWKRNAVLRDPNTGKYVKKDKRT